MGRKKKNTFTEMKMLSSRIEKSDFLKLENLFVDRKGKKKPLQEVMNVFVRSCISGSIILDGDRFIGNE